MKTVPAQEVAQGDWILVPFSKRSKGFWTSESMTGTTGAGAIVALDALELRASGFEIEERGLREAAWQIEAADGFIGQVVDGFQWPGNPYTYLIVKGEHMTAVFQIENESWIVSGLEKGDRQ